MHEVSCFVTLTYRPEALPQGGTLVKKHFQDFMKRLRARRARRISYFHCGEYGEREARPHYHALLFGVDFEDKRPWRKAVDGSQLFVSAKLDALWGHGFTSIGAVTFESAAYVARYCLKKITGAAAVAHYETIDVDTGEITIRQPEYVTMSLNPAIGATWLSEFSQEVERDDAVVARGMEMKPPRYYDKVHEKFSPSEYAKRKAERVKAMNKPAVRANSTPERLAVRERVKSSSLSLFKRNVE